MGHVRSETSLEEELHHGGRRRCCCGAAAAALRRRCGGALLGRRAVRHRAWGGARVDLARDAEGNSYVVGYTFGAFPGFTNEPEVDGYLAKVSPTGELLWADQIGGKDNGENGFYAVVLDGSGGVYVAGVTQQDLHATKEGYSDPVVRKYTTDGQLVWGDQFFGSAVSDQSYLETASDIAVAAGKVYVSGSVDGHGFLRTYSPTGALVSHVDALNEDLYAVAAEGDAVYVAGVHVDPADPWGERPGFVRRIGPDGTTERDFLVEGEPMSLAAGGERVVAGGTAWGEEPASVVTQWDAALAERWTARTSHTDMIWDLALSDVGEVLAAGSDETGSGFVRKHAAADGASVWQAGVEGAGFGVGGVVVEGDDVVFAGASASELVPGGTGAYVATWPLVRTVPLTRLAGPDRISTAVALSREAFPAGADGAVLASGTSFPDAVVAGPLAASLGGPVLLVADALSEVVGDELTRLLEPDATVTVLGGTAAVSAAVADDVRALGFQVTRIAGASRYETAVAAAQAMGSPAAIVADGRTFADALVAGPAAIATGRAVVLSDGPTLPKATRSYLLAVGGGHVAVGGAAATAAPGERTIVGRDRYDTAARVADEFFASAHVVGIASGADFADALSIVPLLGREGAPLLLTPPTALAPATRERVGLHLLEVYLAGGPRAVSTAVEQQLRGVLSE